MDRNERPCERDTTRGFGRGLARGISRRGNGRGYLPQSLLDRNKIYNQAREWSDPASVGRRKNVMYSPTAQGRPQRNIPPLTPAPSEDRFFIDWSSIEWRSAQGAPLVQNILIGETPVTYGVGDAYEVGHGQTTSQPSQPVAIPTISQGSHLGDTGQTIPMKPPLTQNTFGLPPERLNVPEEEIVPPIGPNISNVVMDPAIATLGLQHVETNTQTVVPPSEVIIPPRFGDNISMPHVSLSISGYEPDPWRSSGMRSLFVRT